MNFGWLWCVIVGSSIVTNVTTLVQDVDNEEAMLGGGEGRGV